MCFIWIKLFYWYLMLILFFFFSGKSISLGLSILNNNYFVSIKVILISWLVVILNDDNSFSKNYCYFSSPTKNIKLYVILKIKGFCHVLNLNVFVIIYTSIYYIILYMPFIFVTCQTTEIKHYIITDSI